MTYSRILVSRDSVRIVGVLLNSLNLFVVLVAADIGNAYDLNAPRPSYKKKETVWTVVASRKAFDIIQEGPGSNVG